MHLLIWNLKCTLPLCYPDLLFSFIRMSTLFWPHRIPPHLQLSALVSVSSPHDLYLFPITATQTHFFLKPAVRVDFHFPPSETAFLHVLTNSACLYSCPPFKFFR